MRRALSIAVLLVPLAALAQDVPVPALEHLFPKEADVTTTDSSLSRLEIPPEILAEVKPDFSDVRLFDAIGEEVPWLLDSGLPRQQIFEAFEVQTAKTKNVAREKLPAGDGVPAIARERYEIAVPARSKDGRPWELVFDVMKSGFVRAVRIDTVGADGASTPLVERASIFKLGPQRERMRIPLPASANGTTIAVSLEGQDGAFLEPDLRFESVRALDDRSEARLPLTIASRTSEGGRTVLELARPAGVVPDEIVVETSTPAFDRKIEVWDEGANAGEGALGAGAIYRVQSVALVEDRGLRIAPAHGDRLRVVITDGDSPALKELTVSAVVRRPALVFVLPPRANGGPSGVLRFGGGRAWRPAYDLSGLGALPSSGSRARISAMVYDVAALPRARLGAIRANPSFDARPSLAFVMRAGAAVDARQWHDRRNVTLAPSADGLSRVRLSPADIADARADLGDVRVVDGDSRQWPYLVDRDSSHEWIDSTVAATQKDRQSTFAIALPAAPIVVEEVALSVESPFFDRGFRLVGREALDRPDPRDERSRDVTLATGRLSRRAGDPRPVHVAFPPARLESLLLVVDDGDDAPLPVRSAKVRLPAADLFIVAPSGSYSLLLGNPEEAAPRYEVAEVRDVVLAMESGSADVGKLEENPRFSRASRLAQNGTRDTAVLWIVIVVAVLGLGALTLRLARTPAKPGNPKPDGGGTPA